MSASLDAASDNTYKFTISSSLPNYSKIPFTLTLRDGVGNTWTTSFEMQTYPVAAVVFGGWSVYDTTAGLPINTDGDGDGVWEGNETIRLNIGLKNTGTTSKTITSTSLTTTSSYVTIIDTPTVAHGAISAGSTRYLNGTSSANYSNIWRIKLAFGTPSGTVIPFTLSTTDGVTTWQDWFRYTVP